MTGPATVNFGDLSLYTGGAALPEGDYALYFDVRMHQSVNKKTGATRGLPRLGVMVAAYDLRDPNAEPREVFYSMGRKAHLSFAPDPNTGKGLVAVPNAVGATLPRLTNWDMLLKSFYDSGLPGGVFVNDISMLDGMWAHIQSVPAPEERKGFAQGAKTGDDEGGEEDFKGNDTIAVVSQILDGGKPWEGTGGLPQAAVVQPTAVAAPAPPPRPGPARPPVAAPPAAAAPRPGPGRPGPRPVPPATPQVASQDGLDEESLTQTLIGALGEVMMKPSLKAGGPKLTLRTETFKYLKENAGEAVAQATMNAIFASDDKLGAVLNQVGYGIVGNRVQPQQ